MTLSLACLRRPTPTPLQEQFLTELLATGLPISAYKASPGEDLSSSRLASVKALDTEYVAQIDDDDLIDKALLAQVPLAQPVIMTNRAFIDQKGNILRPRVTYTKPTVCLEDLLNMTTTIGHLFVMQRDVALEAHVLACASLLKLGPSFTWFYDHIFWCELLKRHGSIPIFDEPVYLYRIYGREQLTRQQYDGKPFYWKNNKMLKYYAKLT